MRILVGTIEIGGQLVDLTKAFRKLGHTVTSCVRGRHWLFPDLNYDEDISYGAPDIIRWPVWATGSRHRLLRFPRGAVRRVTTFAKVVRLIRSHDLFVFQWAGTSLLDNNFDLPYLRRLGKKIVYIFNGDDIRHASAFSQQFEGLFTDDLQHEMSRPGQNGPAEQLQNLRRPELLANAVFSVPNQSGLAIRPYMHFLIAVDLMDYAHSIAGRDVPVVVHAPSSAPIKGTSLILEALDRLSCEGVKFELRLLQGVPNSQVLPELANADVAIDQLHYPLHGKFAIEAMASGCAVATCNRESDEPLPRNRPIWHIEPRNVYQQLKVLLTNRSLRLRLAAKGRQYVEQYHDAPKVAQRIIRCVESPNDQVYDHYPTFFARAYCLPVGIVIPKDVQHMTWNVIRRWGLPDDVQLNDMVGRGLLARSVLKNEHMVPRWKPLGIPQAPAFCFERNQVEFSSGHPLDCDIAFPVSR